ncbi:hypothetical protein [Roseibacillus ishigakijimensis]|uniref:Uncharacterized protein n=1 Tax=Roseibacillus ishigakijimensis TaxID=454146 RepID=A0A934RRI6_9BACT|nr:hypothetical protein [Roseibacillus ishigakijimensis]MBK1833211.1 hypothetical protein [Roseibacillus ishigakijimensis]
MPRHTSAWPVLYGKRRYAVSCSYLVLDGQEFGLYQYTDPIVNSASTSAFQRWIGLARLSRDLRRPASPFCRLRLAGGPHRLLLAVVWVPTRFLTTL